MVFEFLTLDFISVMVIAAIWILRVLPLRSEYISTILFTMTLGILWDNMLAKAIIFVILLIYVYWTRDTYAAIRAAETAEFERRFGKQPAN